MDSVYAIINRQIDEWNGKSSFGYGMSSTGWILELMRDIGIETEDTSDWLESLDQILIKECYAMSDMNNFDYFKGASGLIFYFLSKKNISEEVHRLLVCFVNALEKSVNTKSSYYYMKDRNGVNEMVLNLGVPHGIIGNIPILVLVKEIDTLNGRNVCCCKL